MKRYRAPLLLLSGIVLVCAGAVQADEDKFDIKLNEFVLKDATLDEAVGLLQDRTHANIVVDWNADGMKKFDRAKKVNVRLYDVSAMTVLEVLRSVYSQKDRCILAVWIREDIAHLGPHDAGELATSLSTRVYDVRDFTQRLVLPNHPTTRPSATGLFGNSSPGASQSAAQPSTVLQQALSAGLSSDLTRQECMDILVRIIQEIVSPDTWRDNGGSVGAIREFDGLLLVTQDPQNHHKIELLLKNIRALRAAIDRGEPPRAEGIDLLKE